MQHPAGRSVDQRADLYALGATLYELATGAAPFALHLRATQAMVPPALDQLTAQLDHATAEATGGLDELRGISRGLHPAVLARGGLRPAP
jgi:hypothetical protein